MNASNIRFLLLFYFLLKEYFDSLNQELLCENFDPRLVFLHDQGSQYLHAVLSS